MSEFDWGIYGILVVMGAFGAVAVIPYAFKLNEDRFAQAPMPPERLTVLIAVQGIVLTAIMAFAGLLAANEIGLSVESDWGVLPLAVTLGVIGTLTLLALEQFIFVPHLPEPLKGLDKEIAFWKRLLASFYGGINEEILTRLFLVSVIAWLLGRVTDVNDAVYAAAIVLAALIFGLGHLPTTAAITRLTPLIVIRALLLNGIIGLICGWLYWQHGLAAAMIAHFSADIVLHVITPILKPANPQAANALST